MKQYVFVWCRAQCSSRAWRDKRRSSSRRAEARDWGDLRGLYSVLNARVYRKSSELYDALSWKWIVDSLTFFFFFFVFIGCVGVSGSHWSCCVSRRRGWSRRGGGRDLLHLFRALDHGRWPPLGCSALWSPVWLHLHFPLVDGRRK